MKKKKNNTIWLNAWSYDQYIKSGKKELEINNLIDWYIIYNYKIGDIIYIYISYPEQKIKYKVEVIDYDYKERNGKFKSVKYKLLYTFNDNESLSYRTLKAKGLLRHHSTKDNQLQGGFRLEPNYSQLHKYLQMIENKEKTQNI